MEKKKTPQKKKLTMLTKEAILAADDRKYQDVEVPEWGGAVRVMAMSGTERDAWENTIIDDNGKIVRKANARADLVARCVVDEDGDRMFTEDDIAALGAKSSAALDRVFAVCQKVNNLGGEVVEELVGNSEAGH